MSQVGRALGDWLGTGKIVEVEVPGNGTGNPWLDAWGRSADDPDFDEYVAELRKLRAAQAI